MTPSAPPTPGAFAGWRMAGLALVSQLAAVGASTYIAGLYIDPLAAEFSLSRGAIGLSISAAFAVSALITPLVGAWMDRGGARAAMSCGALLFALGLSALAASSQPWQLLAALLGPCAAGIAMLGVAPAGRLVSAWFSRHRGKALGIAATGTSIGGFALPQLATSLIERFGWRQSLLYLAAVSALALAPMLWRWVAPEPAALGQRPDGASAPGAVAAAFAPGWLRGLAAPPALAAAAATAPLLALRAFPGLSAAVAAAATLAAVPALWWLFARSPRAGSAPAPASQRAPLELAATLASRDFWGIAAPFMLVAAATSMLLTYMAPFAREIGMSAREAASMVSLCAAFGVVGKLAYGAMLDRFDQRWVFASVPAALGALWPLLFVFPGRWALGTVAVAAGLGIGGILPAWNALVAARFGVLRFGRVIGVMGIASTPLTMTVIWFSGNAFDTHGSYLPAFELAFWAFPLALLIAVAALRPPPA